MAPEGRLRQKLTAVVDRSPELRTERRLGRPHRLARIRRVLQTLVVPGALAATGGVIGVLWMLFGVFGGNNYFSPTERLMEQYSGSYLLGFFLCVAALAHWSRLNFKRRLEHSEVARTYGGLPMTDAEIFTREWKRHRTRALAFTIGLTVVLYPAMEMYLRPIRILVEEPFSRFPFCLATLLTIGVNIHLFTLGGTAQMSKAARFGVSLIGGIGMASGALSQGFLSLAIHYLNGFQITTSAEGELEINILFERFLGAAGGMFLISFLCACGLPIIICRTARHFRFSGDLPVGQAAETTTAPASPATPFDESSAESEIRRKFATVRNDFQPRGIFERLLHRWYTGEERDVAEMLRARGDFTPFDHWYATWPCAVISVAALTAYIAHRAIQIAEMRHSDDGFRLDPWQLLGLPVFFCTSLSLAIPISFTLVTFIPAKKKMNGVLRISGSLFGHWPHYPASFGCVRQVVVKKAIVFWLSAFGPVAFLLFSLFLFSDQLTLLDRSFTFPKLVAVILKTFSLVIPSAVIGLTVGTTCGIGTPRVFSKFNVQRIGFTIWYILMALGLPIWLYLFPIGWFAVLHLVVIAWSFLVLRRFIKAIESPDMDFRTEKL